MGTQKKNTDYSQVTGNFLTCLEPDLKTGPLAELSASEQYTRNTLDHSNVSVVHAMVKVELSRHFSHNLDKRCANTDQGGHRAFIRSEEH